MSDGGKAGAATPSLVRMGVPLFIAGLIFFIFPALSELYELQLREFSAALGELFLRITHLDVSRQGTILSLPGMTFDIIPACSGSEMLRTLIFVGILWAGIHPHISPPRKVVATLLAGVVAILANGVRLTMLLWASYLRGEVIAEGLLHDLIGLSAFAIALPGFFVITEMLARKREPASADPAPSRNMLAFTVVLTALAYVPVFSASALAWIGTSYNQFDRYGYVFGLIGVGGWLWAWRTTSADYAAIKAASVLFAAASLAAFLSQLPGPNYYVLGITLMISIFAIGGAYRSFHFALRCLPFQFIMFLSFPKVSEIINFALNTSGTLVPLASKGLLTLIALGVFVRFCLPLKRPPVALRAAARWSTFMTASAAMMLLGMLFMVRTDFSTEARSYVLPYLLGAQAEWQGSDIRDAWSVDFYRRSNVLNRHYLRDNEQVGVMVVPSDGNRKTIHTPEYCQIGLGWEPIASQTIAFTHAQGLPASARKLQLVHRETGVNRTFIYWFGDEEGVTIANYPEFVIADTWRKLWGKETNWSLYVVWSDTNPTSAVDFLASLPIIRPRD